jgi:hypothetical protein
MATLLADARVTASAVKEVIETELTDAEVNACINTANVLIQGRSRMLTELSDDTLTQIELWLAAHFVSVRDPRVAQETVDDTTIRYELPKAGSLTESTYGQVAVALDTTLSLVGSTVRRAVIEVL